MRKPGSISAMLIIAIMVMLMVPGAVRAGGSVLAGSETRITTDAADQLDPAISDNIIVYTDYRGADADIWYYDLSTGTEAPATTAPGNQVLTDVSGGVIVYNDYDLGDVLTYTPATSTTVNLTNNAGAHRAEDPSIGGNIVAWQDTRNLATSSYDIYARDLTTGEERRISTAAGADRSPAVSGGIIVWESCSATACDIWSYNWETNTSMQLTSSADNEQDPDVSGAKVVWSEYSATTGGKDILLSDLTAGTTQRLALTGDQVNPNISGDFVAFEDVVAGFYHVKLWYLLSDEVFDLTAAPGGPPATADQYLNDIDGNRVVYTDDRGGQLDIYMYEFQTTIPVSSSRWYLYDSNHHFPVGSPSYLMSREQSVAEGTVTIQNGESVIWIADVEALVSTSFPAGEWSGSLAILDGEGTCDIEVGKWIPDGGDGLFISYGIVEDLRFEGASGVRDNPFTVPVAAFDLLAGERLACRITPVTGKVVLHSGSAPDAYGQSWIQIPDYNPAYPVPELPTVLLLGAGLVGVAGVLGLGLFKRRRLAGQ
jgi:beta propeller repeat protein